MAANANAIASNVNVNEVESAVAHSLGVVTDEFGRDEAERTVMLESADAEAVDQEVTAGEHQTYNDALHYVITRGLAEIKRQRQAQAEARAKTELKAKRDLYTSMLKLNPALVTDQNFVNKMIAELGMVGK